MMLYGKSNKTIRAADGHHLLDASNGKLLGVIDGQLAWVSKA